MFDLVQFYMIADTPQRHRPIPHVHALLSGSDLQPVRLMKAWEKRNGWARVERIYDLTGAVDYVVGHIVRGGDYDFSNHLRPPNDAVWASGAD